MNTLNPHIFREYDIRGIAGQDLTTSLVFNLGRIFASRLREELGIKTPPRVAVGRDGRLSSPQLAEQLALGLARGGAMVDDVGLVPSPGLYFAMHHFKADAGIMITGSHNPPDYNGMKMVKTSRPVYGSQIQDLKEALMAERFQDHPGGSVRQANILEPYLQRLVQDFKPGRRVKVVLDCGNGASGVIAPQLLRHLPGIEGEVILAEVDGRFPNHHPDPTLPENLHHLRRRMEETGAELGIAYDGDGDRIGALDHQGRIIWGDRMMILFARQILARQPGATIIGDAKCSQVMFDAVARAGGKPLMWKTGHSLIKTKMKETGAPLAGEMSGHLFFADRYLGFDDALYATVRLIEIVAESSETLAQRLSDLPEVHATPELRIDCPDAKKFQVMERILRGEREKKSDFSDIDGVRVRCPGGWWLLRVSNTQPALVARVEADSRKRLLEIVRDLEMLLQPEGVKLPSWE
ncbi:MAG: phosphomannomutase/phosphoglucomutase [Magnetococcales bacterium]|nr:phosphomannomutase/phosphoglucomutase [Magnetococcales bacterium]MBF0150563.1 phosphomannomutase/phosphoglucomutase [Magnetococcales bacterium]MBF0174844.1 phosphomannomutase/phosphoglucomutase [Magnetococcales bacterium]